MNERDKLVKAALKLMKQHGLPPERQEGAREDISLAMMESANDFGDWDSITKTKKMKKAFEKWVHAARQVRAANDELREIAESAYTSGSLLEGNCTVEMMLNVLGFEALDHQLDQMLTEIKPIPLRPSGPPRPSKPLRERAAREALRLIRRHRLSDATTRGGLFCQLAAVLAFEPKEDLQLFCIRAKKASREPGSK